MPFFNDLPLTKPEHEKLILGTAKFILESSMLSRREGILALINDETNQYGELTGKSSLEVSDENLPLSNEGKAIIKRIFQALVDGLESADIFDIAFYSIKSSQKLSADEGEKLALMMVAEAACGIQQGVHPRIVFTKIASMTGDDFSSKLFSAFETWEDEIIKKRWPPKDLEPSNAAFDIRSFDDIIFQAESVIKDVVADNMDILASALVGVETEVKNKVMRCVPPEKREEIENQIAEINECSPESQAKIVADIKKCLEGKTLIDPKSALQVLDGFLGDDK